MEREAAARGPWKIGHSKEDDKAFWDGRGVHPERTILGNYVGHTNNNLPIRRFWHEALWAQVQHARSSSWDAEAAVEAKNEGWLNLR